MKVIENRPLPTNVYPKRIFCHTCTSLIEYDAKDELVQSVKSLTDDSEYLAKGFICPVCSNVVITG